MRSGAKMKHDLGSEMEIFSFLIFDLSRVENCLCVGAWLGHAEGRIWGFFSCLIPDAYARLGHFFLFLLNNGRI